MLSPQTDVKPLPLVLACAVGLLAPGSALAIERQLQVAARAGFGYSSGTHGGPGAAFELGATYGLNDAFSLYAVGGYSLEFPDSTRLSPRHAGSLSAGVFYAFDYLRVVPYLGLGVRGDVYHVPNATFFTPAAEARGGAVWLLNRTWAIDLQAAYAFPFLERDRSGDFVTVTAGLVWQRDL